MLQFLPFLHLMAKQPKFDILCLWPNFWTKSLYLCIDMPLSILHVPQQEQISKMQNLDIGKTIHIFFDLSFHKHLNTLKSKHSKSEFLECSDVKMAEYIEDPRLNTRKKHLLFSLRSNTLDVKGNFKISLLGASHVVCSRRPKDISYNVLHW